MSDQSPPLPPPAGYDSWLEYAIVGAWSHPDHERGKAARAELEALRKSNAELELKCARANESLDYAIALQRAIEYACCGKQIPEEIACKCPHHAKKLNAHVFNLKAAIEQIRDLIPQWKTPEHSTDEEYYAFQTCARDLQSILDSLTDEDALKGST